MRFIFWTYQNVKTSFSIDPRKFGGENGNNAEEESINELILEVTRVVLALGVFAIGEEISTKNDINIDKVRR